MNGFEKRAEAIKEKIRRTVMELLRESEPKKVRIADIAAKAGISQVTIYNYFGSKEALLREVFLDSVVRATDDFEAVVAELPTMKEAVQLILVADREVYLTFPPEFVRQMVLDDKECAAFIESLYRNRVIPLVVRFIEEGKARGEITEKVSTESIMAYIQFMKERMAPMLDLLEKSGDTDRFLGDMIHLFFYGISGKE
ncbi:TetR/AcrR family transcriptional regulator [Cohnella sp. AR92]|uniref:TetR/AcrR family transcriptional regulator n=1 Tax=Cohnella sp. AR92 TaxID=648716 RepID=UPI001315623F|nr:TetR/AcrR family transcriptional regulator [Cohnella sp. AR92]